MCICDSHGRAGKPIVLPISSVWDRFARRNGMSMPFPFWIAATLVCARLAFVRRVHGPGGPPKLMKFVGPASAGGGFARPASGVRPRISMFFNRAVAPSGRKGSRSVIRAWRHSLGTRMLVGTGVRDRYGGKYGRGVLMDLQPRPGSAAPRRPARWRVFSPAKPVRHAGGRWRRTGAYRRSAVARTKWLRVN